MTTSEQLPERLVGDEVSAIDRIRRAALKSIAANGASATTLRAVAASAGVSLGLVQHHFATKAGLIKAVDDYVLALVINAISGPMANLPEDSVAEVGSRLTRFIADEPDLSEYVGRALSDGSPLGSMVFDTLMGFGMSRWHQRSDRGETRPDVDLTWAAINALVLALGGLILRPHIDRHLTGSLISPGQLDRWQNSVNMLLREGLFRQPGSD